MVWVDILGDNFVQDSIPDMAFVDSLLGIDLLDNMLDKG